MCVRRMAVEEKKLAPLLTRFVWLKIPRLIEMALHFLRHLFQSAVHESSVWSVLVHS